MLTVIQNAALVFSRIVNEGFETPVVEVKSTDDDSFSYEYDGWLPCAVHLKDGVWIDDVDVTEPLKADGSRSEHPSIESLAAAVRAELFAGE